MIRTFRFLPAALALALAAAPAWAQVQVRDAWARATVTGQQGTGAFMTLTAPEHARLIGASSPAAGVVEVHEMALQGNVMTMRAIAALDLPAGQPVELRPGGYHVMLMDLKRPLKVGDKVAVELRFDSGGKRSTQNVQLEVRSTAPVADPHKH